MNQLVQMIMKSNERLERCLDNGSDIHRLSAARKEAEFQLKTLQLVLNAYAIESKNKRAMSRLEKLNILDNTTAIELLTVDPNYDKIKCPTFDHLITRAECLDISGSGGDDCIGCKTGIDTKNKLLEAV